MVEEKKQTIVKDKSIKGWIIVIASFLTNFLVFGTHNCFGVILDQLRSELATVGIENVVTKTSFVGSLAIGMTMLMCPVAGVLIDYIGARKTAFIGGIMAVTGMISSAFTLQHVEVLYFTYGVLFGGGGSLVYGPSIVALGHYFDKYLGLVNGILAIGSSVATVTLPYILQPLLQHLGLSSTFLVTGSILFILVLCAFFYNIPRPEEAQPIFNKDIWKNRTYIIWIIGVPISMFGYFVPYTHLVSFSKQVAPDSDAKLLITCIGLMSGLGRLFFGKIADLPKVNRIMLQQMAMACMGISTMLMSCANSFTWLIITSLTFGLFDGCFVVLFGILCFDICGSQGASQGIGFLYGLKAIPVMAGPPIAGQIYTAFNESYVNAFLVAGIPQLVGAAILMLAHFKRQKSLDLERPEAATYDNRGLDLTDDGKAGSNPVNLLVNFKHIDNSEHLRER